MQIPDGFQFSKTNFTAHYWPEDEYPLMPNYSTLGSHMKSFPESCDIAAEEKDFLTNLGFYYIGPFRSGWPGDNFPLAYITYNWQALSSGAPLQLHFF